MFVTLEVGDIMSKMTKKQARDRLHEASVKILKVWIQNPGNALSSADLNEMAKFAQNTLSRLEKKLK